MTQTISYLLRSQSTYILLLFLIMACVTTWALTIDYYKLKPNTAELDMKVVNATYKAAADYCHKVKSKNFVVGASGLEIQAGCGKVKR